jgi:fatty-acyl-CoA synthase
MLQSVTSYVHGVCDEPLLGETIGTRFDRAVAQWGSREALVVPHQNVRWTYSKFAEKVNAFASGLLALGLRPGDRIGIWSPNNSEWAVVQFPTAKIGLILVTINPAYRGESRVRVSQSRTGARSGNVAQDQQLRCDAE